MACIVFLLVRTASSRLSRKALLEIMGKPLVKIIIERISTAKDIKDIVVCTTTLKSDDELALYLKDNNIEVFRGANKDILDRLYSASKKYKASKIVIVEGDDLFCDPNLITKTCEILSKTDYEFVVWQDLPLGVSPVGIKTEKLSVLINEKDVRDTETGWGHLVIESNLFKVGRFSPEEKRFIRPEIRLTIDYTEDYELAKKLYQVLPSGFSLMDIIITLDKNPEWLKINEIVKDKYKRNFAKKAAKLVMKKRKQVK